MEVTLVFRKTADDLVFVAAFRNLGVAVKHLQVNGIVSGYKFTRVTIIED